MSATTLRPGDAPARLGTSARLGRRRQRTDKVVTALAVGCTAIGLFFLASILFTLIWRGLGAMDLRVFTEVTRPPGSNGGLLMGAVLTQRPDLFRAVVIQVPLLDMLRYHRFLIARLWIPEYGSAEDPEQFPWLRAYSPYHHVREGVAYPAVLLATARR